MLLCTSPSTHYIPYWIQFQYELRPKHGLKVCKPDELGITRKPQQLFDNDLDHYTLPSLFIFAHTRTYLHVRDWGGNKKTIV